jgi:hypothetical protein
MELIPVILAVILAISLLFSAYLYALLRRSRRKPGPVPTLEAEQLLHDLTANGQAVLRVTVIDPRNLLLRRPRG